MGGRGRGANPLAHVLQALGEPLDLLTYKNWNVLTPEGQFLTEVGAYQFCDVLQQIRGPEAVQEWKRLQVGRPWERGQGRLWCGLWAGQGGRGVPVGLPPVCCKVVHITRA